MDVNQNPPSNLDELPQDMPSMVEIVQEMSIEEAKKRWPKL